MNKTKKAMGIFGIVAVLYFLSLMLSSCGSVRYSDQCKVYEGVGTNQFGKPFANYNPVKHHKRR